MCLSSPASQPLPPVASAPPTIADAAVQRSRNDEMARATAAGGLGSTQLTSGLGGKGAGNKKLAGTPGSAMNMAS